jgi:hypothetical protein
MHPQPGADRKDGRGDHLLLCLHRLYTTGASVTARKAGAFHATIRGLQARATTRWGPPPLSLDMQHLVSWCATPAAIAPIRAQPPVQTIEAFALALQETLLNRSDLLISPPAELTRCLLLPLQGSRSTGGGRRAHQFHHGRGHRRVHHHHHHHHPRRRRQFQYNQNHTTRALPRGRGRLGSVSPCDE